MGLYEQLTTSGGESIDFSRLGTVTAGILAGSVASGFSAVIEGSFSAFVIRPLGGLSSWIDSVISGTFAGFYGWIVVAGAQAEAFVRDFGVLGFLIALAIVLAMLYVIAWAVSSWRES